MNQSKCPFTLWDFWVILTFPPPGWCFMLSVEPILERTFLTFLSGVDAVPWAGGGVCCCWKWWSWVAVVVEGVVVRGARGTRGFFSVVVVVPVLEERRAGLVATVRVRATTGGCGGAAGPGLAGVCCREKTWLHFFCFLYWSTFRLQVTTDWQTHGVFSVQYD